ncbi:MAG: serine hydrolase [Phycisphaerae bacterium]|nr:serine hydrolase [Phycisphaerae bacterium]
MSLLTRAIAIAGLWAMAFLMPTVSAQPMVFPGETWAESLPEEQDVDGTGLNEAVAYLRAHAGRDGVRELVIVRNGVLIYKGDNIDKVHGVWSMTKSFTSTVLGLLVDEGKVTVNTRAKDFVPSMARDFPEVTLLHFTTMTSGYRAVGDEPRSGYLHGPSSTPFTPGEPLFAPGAKYAYWDSAMNQFGNVLTRVAGERIEDLFKRRIADPIGMDAAQWDWGEFGKVDGLVVNGGSGNSNKHMFISARQMARFGHLYLNRGMWNGKQLLSSEWVDTATRNHVPADLPLGHKESGIDGLGVYGCNWWVNGIRADGERLWPGAPAGAYAASGHNNNKMVVIPEWRMVIVRLGLDQADGVIGNDVWSTFLEKVGTTLTDTPGPLQVRQVEPR